LDALCLDPNAEVFLGERVDLLLGNNGRAAHPLAPSFSSRCKHTGRAVKAVSRYLYADPSFSLFFGSSISYADSRALGAVARF